MVFGYGVKEIIVCLGRSLSHIRTHSSRCLHQRSEEIYKYLVLKVHNFLLCRSDTQTAIEHSSLPFIFHLLHAAFVASEPSIGSWWKSTIYMRTRLLKKDVVIDDTPRRHEFTKRFVLPAEVSQLDRCMH